MNYQLHDYEVDSIILKKDRIIFSFPNGFYVEEAGKRFLSKSLPPFSKKEIWLSTMSTIVK